MEAFTGLLERFDPARLLLRLLLTQQGGHRTSCIQKSLGSVNKTPRAIVEINAISSAAIPLSCPTSSLHSCINAVKTGAKGAGGFALAENCLIEMRFPECVLGKVCLCVAREQ